jgi:hypothetical protein
LISSKDLATISKAFKMAQEANKASSMAQGKVRRLQRRMDYLFDGSEASSMGNISEPISRSSEAAMTGQEDNMGSLPAPQGRKW